ncbi:hypothetical protein T02_1746 [Trichinella nativa]|uniref:Uncharacterized protein n=1 Tax=Trichinella nativa TaxID=6335 RepID=A0A0V1KX36_9BILA|nr:hypothetical protein T02_1746 [Trichinella nativa]
MMFNVLLPCTIKTISETKRDNDSLKFLFQIFTALKQIILSLFFHYYRLSVFNSVFSVRFVCAEL